MAGDVITDMAKKLCQRHPDAPARTLARRLVRESNGAVTLEQARKRITRQFGVHGNKHRKRLKPVAPRPKRQAGEQRAMPKSLVICMRLKRLTRALHRLHRFVRCDQGLP